MKSALITGSSRGIGRETALTFARHGYCVAVNCAHRLDELKKVQGEIEALGAPCLAFQADVGNYEEASHMIHSILKEWGSLSVLVNNAGIASIGLFQDMSYEQYHHMLETNLTSVLNCCHLAVPDMVRNHEGKIINISSIWGNVGASCEAVYSAAKGGINSFTRALGKELAPSGIQVNAIACGVIDTEMNACLDAEEKKALEQEIPAGRFGKASEVAELVYAIASGHSYLNGQVITLDGAYL
ncbi:MAG: SDR family NAD(P)-dependent oxidoreductase [Lachnospiraceae bacterium]|nr:SDR family NAD(P)-dependent oxidoreductase [Lachnospiraceae bacterium]